MHGLKIEQRFKTVGPQRGPQQGKDNWNGHSSTLKQS